MNLNGNLVDAQNREVYTAGGSNAWHTTTYRGYTVILEWLVGAQSTEPMLYLRAARSGPNDGAFAICLSSIGAYADPSGGAAPGALDRARDALSGLGKNVIDMEARALLDVILRFAPDLINMPPAPMLVRRAELATGAPRIDVEIRHESSGKTHSEVAI